MSSKLYSVFKEKGSVLANDLVFSQKGYIKHKIQFKDLRLLIIHFPERSFHFVAHFNFFYTYHIGDQFTEFLKVNGVPHAEYHLAGIDDDNEGIYHKKGGGTMAILIEWVQTGWNYSIVDHDNEQPTLNFSLSKVNKLRFDQEEAEVEFIAQGDLQDPEIQKAFKDVTKSKSFDRRMGCIKAILIIIAFFLLGQIWTWIFGEPEDPFNILMPNLFFFFG